MLVAFVQAVAKKSLLYCTGLVHEQWQSRGMDNTAIQKKLQTIFHNLEELMCTLDGVTSATECPEGLKALENGVESLKGAEAKLDEMKKFINRSEKEDLVPFVLCMPCSHLFCGCAWELCSSNWWCEQVETYTCVLVVTM